MRQPVAGAAPGSFTGVLSLCQFLSWGGGFYAFPAVIMDVESAIGLTRAQSGLAFSAALLAEGLASYPVGRWVDRGKDRSVMCVGSIVLAAGLLLQSLASNAAGFIAACVVTGVGFAATLYSPAFAVLARRFPADIRRATITVTLLGGLSSSAFLPVCAWLSECAGWRGALRAMAAVQLLIALPLLWRFLRDSPAAAPVSSRAAALLPHAVGGPAFWFVAAFCVLSTTVAAAVAPHLVAMMREAGVGPSSAVWLAALVGIAQTTSRLLLLGSGRGDHDHWLAGIVPLSLACFLALGGAYSALAFVVLYGAGNGIITVLRGVAVVERVSVEDVGAINGLIGFASSVGRATGPWLLGTLWSPVFGYTTGAIVLMIVGFVAACALAFARPTKTKSS